MNEWADITTTRTQNPTLAEAPDSIGSWIYRGFWLGLGFFMFSVILGISGLILSVLFLGTIMGIGASS